MSIIKRIFRETYHTNCPSCGASIDASVPRGSGPASTQFRCAVCHTRFAVAIGNGNCVTFER